MAKDSTLYVRTYDLSYEFRINDTYILNIETEPTKIKSDDNEIPDTLYVGEGFSISIPDEGWGIYDETLESPALMAAVFSSEISVWIECYKEEELFSVEERLLEEGYTYNLYICTIFFSTYDFIIKATCYFNISEESDGDFKILIYCEFYNYTIL